MCVVVAPIEIQCKEANFPRLVPVLPPLAINFLLQVQLSYMHIMVLSRVRGEVK